MVLSRSNLQESLKESYIYTKEILEIYKVIGTRNRKVAKVYTIGLRDRVRTRN